jgi:hypothetical protein
MTTNNDIELYDAESRMSIRDAILACGEDVFSDDWQRPEKETTIYSTSGAPIVSFWSTTTGDIEARWHQREECNGMDGAITCDDGEAEPHGYYSHLNMPTESTP